MGDFCEVRTGYAKRNHMCKPCECTGLLPEKGDKVAQSVGKNSECGFWSIKVFAICLSIVDEYMKADKYSDNTWDPWEWKFYLHWWLSQHLTPEEVQACLDAHPGN